MNFKNTELDVGQKVTTDWIKNLYLREWNSQVESLKERFLARHQDIGEFIVFPPLMSLKNEVSKKDVKF